MIDDFKNKRRGRRINVDFVGLEEEPLRPIDLTFCLRKLASLYYKTDLLHSIAVALNQGVQLENVLVFDKSLQQSSIIEDKRSLHMLKDVEIFYRHGFHGLYQDLTNEELQIIFRSFRGINTNLYNYDYKTIHNKKIGDIIQLYFDQGFKKTLDYTFLLPNEKNSQVAYSDPQLLRELKSLLDQSIHKHRQFLDNLDEWKSIGKILRDTGDRVLNSSQRIMVKRHIEPFFDAFNVTDFPIVMVREKQNFTVLCHYHFSKSSSQNPFYFDIREVSHNSPTLIAITVAFGIIAPLFMAFGKVLKLRKAYWDGEKAKAETKNLKADNLKREDEDENRIRIEAEIKNLIDLIEKYSNAETEFLQTVVLEIDNIPYHYYRQRLRENIISIENEYLKVLEKCKIQIRSSSYRK
jgi:hypothetical protein